MTAWAHILSRTLPLPHYWKVTLTQLDDFGASDWSEDKDRFEIRLDPRWGYYVTRETLAHEWAHCVCWDLPGSDHSPMWGVAYAQAYRALVED